MKKRQDSVLVWKYGRNRDLKKQKQYKKKYRIKNKNKLSSEYKIWALSNPTGVKINNARNNLRLIKFKDKRFAVKNPPRTGICSKCHKSVHKGEIKRTAIHHDQYDEFNPLAHTRELCVSCHNKYHYGVRHNAI